MDADDFKKILPIGIIMLILANLAGWTIYETIKMAVKDGMLQIGIQNLYTQNLIILVVLFVLLIIFGKDLKEVLD